MRIAGLLAVSAMVAACSQSVGGQAEPPGTNLSAAPPRATTPTLSPAPRTPSRTPSAGAPIEDVIAWIEAGPAADPGAFHEAFLDGVTTPLGDDIAFTAGAGAPDDTTRCVTDAAYNSGGLTCLLELNSPTPRPAGGEGVWKAGWIDYAGASMQVGSLHGDPGPFVEGNGPRLTDGQSLAFGDFRCRSDTAGLFCANYAHRTAAGISAEGVVAFGCLQAVTRPPPDAGAMYSC